MRLIDADALKKAFDFDSDVELEVGVVQFGIDNAPTVDAVPVVRCRECIYGVQEELFDLDGVNHRSMEWHCMKNDLSVIDDWFCADGEAR